MKWFRGLATLTILVLVFLWGIVFATKNGQAIALDLVFLQLPEANLSVWIVGGFALGGILGLLIALTMATKLKAQQRKTLKQLDVCEKELASYRANAVKDPKLLKQS